MVVERQKPGGSARTQTRQPGNVPGRLLVHPLTPPARHLWQWFDLVNRQGRYAYRLNATILLQDAAGKPVLKFTLDKALPVKFKAPDLNATGGEVGIEELHLVHEGLNVTQP